MSGERDWSRLDDLLDDALEQPPERRRAWLDEACAGDEGLRSRVESLVELAEEDDGVLTPGGGLRGPVWDDVADELGAEDPASMLPGTRLGAYEIRGVLGAGGMGRVYRARDPGLDRDVAIKALFREFSADQASLRRFEREARLLATLSHPSIASIYGFHVFDERPYLVLELVEGETLDQILEGGPLSTKRAVSIGRQVAEALEEAHGKGIVHRDLKPSNVKVSPGERVKVLDFGLARRVGPGPGKGTSTAGTVTREGTVLGTAPYMSPEQARGEAVDERTDIWAFGCLLYEMLTGHRAFEARTVPELLASVLRDEVDCEAVPPETPAALRRLLRRCLQKDPRRRFQHVGDLHLELEEVETGPATLPGHQRAPGGSRLPSALLPWAVAVLAVVAALALLFTRPPREAGPAPALATRLLGLDLPPQARLPQGDHASPVALLPDGSGVVVLAEEGDTTRLYHRDFERLAWTPLPGTEGAWQPFASADSREVGFFAERQLRRVALDGSPSVTVVEVSRNARGAAWAADGTIVFAPAQTSGLVRVDARGGLPRPLTELDPSTDELSHRWPQVLPDGRTVLFTVGFESASFDDAALELVSLDDGERVTLLRGGSHGRHVAGGHLVYGRGGQLFAAPFDTSRSRVTGTPVVVADPVAYDPRNGGTKIAVAGDGTLAWVPGPGGGAAPAGIVLAQGWASGLTTPATAPR